MITEEIAEDYVSFETAKLLKEKGFMIPYDSFRGVYINGVFKRLNPGDGYGYNLGDEIVDVCSLQLAMKWLREVHNRHISIEHSYILNRYRICITKYNPNSISDLNNMLYFSGGYSFDTYEKACEAAIKYCLEKLI